uniref:uncharacterized protein isoform X1 n=2 Tax=Myxine glutinosa TaxID=7769 RepID=UPI003590163D
MTSCSASGTDGQVMNSGAIFEEHHYGRYKPQVSSVIELDHMYTCLPTYESAVLNIQVKKKNCGEDLKLKMKPLLKGKERMDECVVSETHPMKRSHYVLIIGLSEKLKTIFVINPIFHTGHVLKIPDGVKVNTSSLSALPLSIREQIQRCRDQNASVADRFRNDDSSFVCISPVFIHPQTCLHYEGSTQGSTVASTSLLPGSSSFKNELVHKQNEDDEMQQTQKRASIDAFGNFYKRIDSGTSQRLMRKIIDVIQKSTKSSILDIEYLQFESIQGENGLFSGQKSIPAPPTTVHTNSSNNRSPSAGMTSQVLASAPTILPAVHNFQDNAIIILNGMVFFLMGKDNHGLFPNNSFQFDASVNTFSKEDENVNKDVPESQDKCSHSEIKEPQNPGTSTFECSSIQYVTTTNGSLLKEVTMKKKVFVELSRLPTGNLQQEISDDCMQQDLPLGEKEECILKVDNGSKTTKRKRKNNASKSKSKVKRKEDVLESCHGDNKAKTHSEQSLAHSGEANELASSAFCIENDTVAIPPLGNEKLNDENFAGEDFHTPFLDEDRERFIRLRQKWRKDLASVVQSKKP